MKQKLKSGDRVKVDCNNAMTTILFDARIIHIPVATGDCWIFKPLDIQGDPLEDEVVYISEGITITYLNEEK